MPRASLTLAVADTSKSAMGILRARCPRTPTASRRQWHSSGLLHCGDRETPVPCPQFGRPTAAPRGLPVPLTVAWHAGEPLRRLAGQSPAAGGRQYKRPSYQEHHHHTKDTTWLDMDSMRLTNRRPRHHTIPTPRDICSSLDNTSLPHRRREQSRSHRRHEHPAPAYEHYRSKKQATGSSGICRKIDTNVPSAFLPDYACGSSKLDDAWIPRHEALLQPSTAAHSKK